jgi:succinyl-diaminopimelate desuccinylase
VQGHVAYPQLAENPVHTLAPALAELTSRHWDEGTEHFQPTSFQVSNVNAGTGAPNVIPGELKARFNLRYSPVQTLDTLKTTVEDILRRHGVRYTLEWYVSGEPFYTAPGVLSHAVADAVAEVTAVHPKLSTGGGTSDGRFIAPLGAQVVELGVVSASIHKVNECVRVADIEALQRMYFNVLRRLLTDAPTPAGVAD